MKADKCSTCEGTGKYSSSSWEGFEKSFDKNDQCPSCEGIGVDTYSDSYVNCPHCGQAHDPDESDIHDTCDINCDSCNKLFEVIVEYSATYQTYKKEEKK